MDVNESVSHDETMEQEIMTSNSAVFDRSLLPLYISLIDSTVVRSRESSGEFALSALAGAGFNWNAYGTAAAADGTPNNSSWQWMCLRRALWRFYSVVPSHYRSKIIITSSFRHSSHNPETQGKSANNSFHKIGLAFDIKYNGIPVKEVQAWILKAKLVTGLQSTYTWSSSKGSQLMHVTLSGYFNLFAKILRSRGLV